MYISILYIKQLNGTFHFVLILAVPVDKGGSVLPILHAPSASPEGDQAAARETDLQLEAEATGIQSEETPARFVWFRGKIRPGGRH